MQRNRFQIQRLSGSPPSRTRTVRPAPKATGPTARIHSAPASGLPCPSLARARALPLPTLATSAAPRVRARVGQRTLWTFAPSFARARTR